MAARARPGRWLALVAGLAAGLVGGCGPEAVAARQPSVVLIVVDTLRADLGRAHTPAIHRFAGDGVAFSRAFSHAPMTLPSHAALFASRPPAFTGVLNNRDDVREDLPLLAEWLRDHGYDTQGVVSMAVLNPRGENPGLGRGFEHFDADYRHMDPAPRALARMRAALDRVSPSRPFFLFAHFSDPHSPFNAHGTTRTSATVSVDGEPLETLMTSDMVQRDYTLDLDAGEHVFEVTSERPFYLHAFQWQHDGENAKPRWERGQYNRRGTDVSVRVDLREAGESRIHIWIAEALEYWKIPLHYHLEVEYLDAFVGELLEDLQRRGLYDDTVVVFTSDHGEGMGHHGLMGQHVHTLYDDLLRVPLVIKPHDDGRARELLAERRNEVVAQQDLVPTILELVGLPPLPGQMGTSLLSGTSRTVVAQTHAPEAHEDHVALRNDAFKLIYSPAQGSFQMFDLQADPGELTDVFAEEQHRLPEGWTATLEGLAAQAASAERTTEILPETQKMLEALGYAETSDG